MKLRAARQAFRDGRLDEAGQLLERDELLEFLPAKKLAHKVAEGLVARAEERIRQGETQAGWQDAMAAGRLGGHDQQVDHLRREYVDRTLQEVYRNLAAGEAEAGLERLKRLEKQGLGGGQARQCRQVAELVRSAQHDAHRGRNAEAASSLLRAKALLDKNTASEHGTMELAMRLGARSEELSRQASQLQGLSGELHAALTAESWSRVLSAADAMLAMAPSHTAARQARRKAWQAVGLESTQLPSVAMNGRPVSLDFGLPPRRGAGRGRQLRKSTCASLGAPEEDTVTGHDDPLRLLLWIDAVGGYLMCLDDYLVLGQPMPDQPIAIPILADLSRRHAVLRRDGGSYVLEPVHETYLDGRAISEPTLLGTEHTIGLGSAVRMQFRKPHALSSTARLNILSNHKTQPSADGILLMAESCVLGPSGHCHVQARDWSHDVILFRTADGLMCRTAEPLVIDGEQVTGPAQLVSGARVEGEDFSLSVEQVVRQS